MAFFDKAGIHYLELKDLLEKAAEVLPEDLPLKPVMERAVTQRFSDGRVKPHAMGGLALIAFFVILDYGGEGQRGLGRKERYKVVGVSVGQEVADVELEEGGSALRDHYNSFQEAISVAGDLNDVSRIHEM